MKHQRGAYLLSAIAALAIMAIALWYAFGRQTQEMNQVRLDQLVKQHADEMVVFTTCAISHVRENPIPQNTLRGYNATNLPCLPSNFATPAGAPTGTSPFGFRYVAYALRDSNDVTRMVITDVGPVDYSRLRTLGMNISSQNEVQAHIALLDRKIAAELANKEAVSAIIPAGTQIANGVSMSFQQDLSAYLPSSIGRDRAASFPNWPEYVTEAPPGGGGDIDCNNPANQATPECFAQNYDSCRSVAPRLTDQNGTTSWTIGGRINTFQVQHAPAQCLSTEDSITTWNGCSGNPQIMVLPWGSTYSVGTGRYGDTDISGDGVADYDTYAIVSLDGVEQIRYQCQSYTRQPYNGTTCPYPTGCVTDIKMHQWNTPGAWCCVRKNP